MGYKVADFPETVELMQASWLAFIQDETKIDSVIYRYRKLGFNACCDLPGNTFYKELYDNIPNCKDELFNKLIIMVEWKQTVRGDFFRNQTVTTAWCSFRFWVEWL